MGRAVSPGTSFKLGACAKYANEPGKRAANHELTKLDFGLKLATAVKYGPLKAARVLHSMTSALVKMSDLEALLSSLFIDDIT